MVIKNRNNKLYRTQAILSMIRHISKTTISLKNFLKKSLRYTRAKRLYNCSFRDAYNLYSTPTRLFENMAHMCCPEPKYS